MTTDIERVRAALSFISPEAREIWVKMGQAIKAEFGDAGFDLWDDWGSKGEGHNPRSAKSVWKSIKATGGVAIGSLFFEAKQAGWVDDGKKKTLSAAEIARRQKLRAERDAAAAAEDALLHAAAAERAEVMWANASPAASHPYLSLKGVQSYGLRVGNWEVVDGSTGEVLTFPDCLLIPMLDRQKKLHSLQCIDAKPGRQKRYLKDGAKQGHFFPIGRPVKHGGKPVFVLAEGYATAASVHAATGHMVLVCFDVSNLLPVAQTLRKRAPDAILIVAADNDIWTPGNPGMSAATKAAQAVNALVAAPPFTVDDATDEGKRLSDWNDWGSVYGLDAVRMIFERLLTAELPVAAVKAAAAVPAAVNEDGDGDAMVLNAFWAFLPAHQYIYVPTRDLWPAPSVNGHVAEWPMDSEIFKVVKPSDWLDRNRAVQQMSWNPGRPMIIEDEVVSSGGWTSCPGSRVFNTYRAPTRKAGNASQAGPWLDHLHRVYPDEWEHIQQWLAHRVQRPGEKINHALVLGGNPGVGKDTLLEPVKMGVGAWNWSEVSPQQINGSQFNPWIQCTVARVSELRDLKEDRFSFYENMKVYIAAPPDCLAVNQKHMREYYVPNVMGVLFTTNHRTDGLYLPADDRRHFVAWSEASKEDFPENYWVGLWQWMQDGGAWHVIEYLRTLSLEGFDPKAPPRKTAAFWAIVHANNVPEDVELSVILGEGANEEAIVLGDIIEKAREAKLYELANELSDRKTRRAIPHKLARVGYVPVHSPDRKDGLWVVDGCRVAVYAPKRLGTSEQIRAARSRAARINHPI